MAELSPGMAARLAVLIALHDLGKFNHGFQAKSGLDRGIAAGHVSEALTLLEDGPAVRPWREQLFKLLRAHALDTWGEGVLPLLAAAISHHGRPGLAAQPTREQAAGWWAANAERDPLQGIAEFLAATRRWLPEAYASGPDLPLQPAFQHGFCGLVQLADWLGSDTEFFPYSDRADSDRWDFAVAAAQRALVSTRLLTSGLRERMASISSFACISGAPAPRPLQAAIGSLPVPQRASLTCIEEETGGGKTEAALWHFARLFAAGTVDGLYFALPTRTAATQLHARIVSACARCFPDPHHRPAVILAVPGYLAADDAIGTRLPGFEVLWNDDPHRQRRHERWAAEGPKRYLAGCVVVGTIDQVLLSTLAVDHAHLRATALLRHLLVVDEVHASDAYMTRLLASVLERLRAAGGHALLMSATLGATARDTYVRSWGSSASTSSLEVATSVPYPMVQCAGQPAAAVGRTGRDRCLRLATAPADDPARIAARAVAAAQAGARVLIIRNTVRDCLATQAAVEAAAAPEMLWRLPTPHGPVPAPHHARFAREDRIALDDAIAGSFGKDARRDGGCIACATQTVQQALDLDADWLISDLCPVDVLLQRCGRLHRHERLRPPGYAEPQVLVLAPAESLARWLDQPRYAPHGWGTVYPDLRMLEATLRLVRSGSWDIPADNRRLVEQATHPEALARLDPQEPRWTTHGQQLLGAALAHGQLAQRGLLATHVGFEDSRVEFPSGELAEDIRTRLGEDNLRLALPEGTASPFGQQIRELVLPARWCRRLDPQAIPQIDQCADSLRVSWDGRPFIYDRLGLRPET
jgi:CRISPR-associated endonuclease/helicase Cas3